MAYVTAIVMLALVQYFYFSIEVGRARGRFGVAAPATSGNEEFERYFRVQQNTLEQLIMFIPAIYATAYYGNPLYAAGVVFLVGRMLFFRSYVKDPASRTVGFLLSMVPSLGMVLAALILSCMTFLG
jgi:glutathione S-transferase